MTGELETNSGADGANRASDIMACRIINAAHSMSYESHGLLVAGYGGIPVPGSPGIALKNSAAGG